MNHLKWYAFLALLIISTYVVVIMQIDDKLTQEHEARVNEQQSLQTQLSAHGIEAHFQWVDGSVANLALRGIPRNIDNTTDPSEIEPALLELFSFAAHSAYSQDKLVLQYISLDGDIVVTYAHSGATTADDMARLGIWRDEFGADVISSETYHVTDFEINEDRCIYGILYPVLNTQGTETIGILIAMLDFNTVIEEYVAPIRHSPFGAIWIQDSTSRVIYDHEAEVINSLVTDLAVGYPDLQRVNRLMMTQDSGQDHYRYPIEIGGRIERKLLAWSTAYLGNLRITIAISAPESDINADLESYRHMMLVAGALLALVLIVGSGIFYTTRQRDLTRLVNVRTQALQRFNSELEQRVTERTRELTAKNAQLTTILETMDDGVIFRQGDQVIYTNPAITRLLGYTRDEVRNDKNLILNLVRQYLNDISFAKLKHALDHSLEHNQVLHEDVILSHKNGETLYARLYITGIHAPDGTLIGTLEIIHDNSHAIILQQQKDRFITNASHELRRPLANLKTRLYLLRQQPEDLPKHLEVLERATDDMTDLVRDLVDVAQFTRDVIKLNRQNITLQTTVEASRALQDIIATRRNVTLSYDITPEPLPLFGDYQRLSQAISNIMIHAINATPPEGTVTLQMTGILNDSEHWGIIRVVDQGSNLDKDDLQNIFNPFYRPSEGTMKSTGLGLTIAHLIINQHGGTIDAKDHPDGGITFLLKIPLSTLDGNSDQTT